MYIHLLFDIDGTLLLSGGAGWVAMQKAFRHLFGNLEIRQVPVHGRTDRGIVADLFSSHGIEDSQKNRDQFFRQYVSQLPEAMRQQDGYLLPGVPGLLGQLSQMPNVRLGLLTGNIEPAAWIKLRHFDVDHHFAFGGFGEKDKDRNQVAEQAAIAAESHSDTIFDREKTIVIGDTTRDISCARWINCRCIGVLTGGSSKQEMLEAAPDLLLDDLSDVDAFVNGISRISGVSA